ncbi:hypothetical protein [Nocardioides mesophilus]|uniref:2-C-methyl-D-erythritol 4-phosphate cytidylyltransferase n=1 Tax=Nocardioides mesophilus TaxID=433659 RepID=A0A7G9RE51_9ACTN|nr:hypothetical protein [Nocardioides mesophilus]QNN53876.1 hypothetical protein H9L09_05645 [Nocardioides mesophilus]
MSEALGVVPTDGRGSMPFALLHGESLVAVAAWAVGHADIELLDFNAAWEDVVARDLPLVVHDPLCPGTPTEFIGRVLERCLASHAVVVGMRGDEVASPVAVPPGVLASLEGWPDLADLPTWVATLRERFPTELVAAPEEARRLAGPDDVLALQELLDPTA